MHVFYRISSQLLSILYTIVNAITFVKLHFLILIAIVRITIDLYMLIICRYLAELLLIKSKGKKEKKCVFSLVAKTLEVICTH